MFSQQDTNFSLKVSKFIEKHGLPFALLSEADQYGDSLYYSIIEQLDAQPRIRESVVGTIPNLRNNLNVKNLKHLIIEHRRGMGTQSINCWDDECINKCTTAKEHFSYLAGNNVSADKYIIEGLTSLLRVRLCLVYFHDKPRYFDGHKRISKQNTLYLFCIPQTIFLSLCPLAGHELLQGNLGRLHMRKKNALGSFQACHICKGLIQNETSYPCRTDIDIYPRREYVGISINNGGNKNKTLHCNDVNVSTSTKRQNLLCNGNKDQWQKVKVQRRISEDDECCVVAELMYNNHVTQSSFEKKSIHGKETLAELIPEKAGPLLSVRTEKDGKMNRNDEKYITKCHKVHEEQLFGIKHTKKHLQLQLLSIFFNNKTFFALDKSF